MTDRHILKFRYTVNHELRSIHIGTSTVLRDTSVIALVRGPGRRDGQEISRVPQHLRGHAHVGRQRLAVKAPSDRHRTVAFGH